MCIRDSIGIELGKMAYRNRLEDADPVTGDRARLHTLSSLVGLFLLGGVVGAAGYLTLGFLTLLLPAGLLLLVAVPPLLDDVPLTVR